MAGNAPESRPQWVEMTPDFFPEGSCGRKIFPAVLQGRFRAVTTFDYPVKTIWGDNYRSLNLREIRDRGFETVAQLLSNPQSVISSFTKARETVDRLEKFLESLAVTPQAHLLNAVFPEEYPWYDANDNRLNKSDIPLPVRHEYLLIDAVNGLVDRLPSIYQKVLTLRFGLEDGVEKTLDTVGQEVGGLSGSRINQREAQALRRLRLPGKKLFGLLPLPEASLARTVFDYELQRDLPFRRALWAITAVTLGDLSIHAQRELERNGIGPDDLFFGGVAAEKTISISTICEVIREYRRVITASQVPIRD